MEHRIKIKILILLLSAFISGVYAQPCLPDGITFTTQAQIDSFPYNYPGCTEIEGYVRIKDDDIRNLDSLEQLVGIHDYFYITNASSLTSLKGLENLSFVGGLSINTCNRLRDLTGLEGLSSINGDLTFAYNDSLLNFQGIGQVDSIHVYFGVVHCDQLMDFSGLESLLSIGWDFTLENNPSLVNFMGLENLNSIGGHFITENHQSLEDFTGLESLFSIGGHFVTWYGDSLICLNGLSQLTKIGMALQIDHNPLLTDITSLGNVDSVGMGVYFRNNSSLENLHGLESLTSIRELMIANNSSLSSLNGLNNVETIETDAYILNNAIYDLSGLNRLTTIEESLSIEENNNLQSLNGLDSLHYIGTSLNIRHNDVLTDLSGLEYLKEVNWLDIGFNPSFTSFNGLVLNTLSHLKIQGNPRLKEIQEFLLEEQEYVSLLDIAQNDSLTGLAGLIKIKSAGHVKIIENNALQDLIGLDSLSSTELTIWIQGNESLVSLSGLNNLEYAPALKIIDNDMLSSITALSNLTELSLEWPVPNIIIIENEILSSLAGIDSINPSLIYKLIITDNPALSTCEVISVCNFLSGGGLNEIHDNTIGCNSEAEVEEACIVGVPEQQIDIELTVYPNPFTSCTTIEFESYSISNIQFTVYNMVGEEMYREERQLAPGEHSITPSLHHLPAGLFYGVLTSEEGVRVVKMVKR